MNVVGHQTIAEYLQLVDLLPLSEVCQVVLIIAALDEHRLAVMAALNNMVGKTGYNHPGLSGNLISCGQRRCENKSVPVFRSRFFAEENPSIARQARLKTPKEVVKQLTDNGFGDVLESLNLDYSDLEE